MSCVEYGCDINYEGERGFGFSDEFFLKVILVGVEGEVSGRGFICFLGC